MAQPGEKPLNFIRSIPSNGATNVSRSLRTMTLVFDKNVIDDSVWANNQKQIVVFKGITQLHKASDYRVTRINTSSQRRNIYIKFLHSLAPNTKYKVAIYPDLISKAGETLGKTVLISFTTSGNGSIIMEQVQE